MLRVLLRARLAVSLLLGHYCHLVATGAVAAPTKSNRFAFYIWCFPLPNVCPVTHAKKYPDKLIIL